LVAERIDQPIEDRRRIVPLDRNDDTVPRQSDPGVIDERPCPEIRQTLPSNRIAR